MNEELKIIIKAEIGDIKAKLKEVEEQIGKTADSSSKLSKLGDTMKKVGGTVAKASAAAFTAAAAGVVAITKQATDNFAEYEQLVGGIDTLFKDSSQKVQKYAADAYKTAGMSANDYMELTTSFTASLLQSLKGDTNAAADAANQAVIDMADNANKMGTSMESIQNAYQGFAKQNYTMLDNLKLGYGGTKEEMQRLLEDAEKISGIKYDISNLNDVYGAIHIIQNELGITGTTAKEASSTIQGSAAAMKGAWSNLLTGLADENADFDSLILNLVDSVGSFAENLIPRVQTALGGVAKLIEGLAPKIVEAIPQLVNSVLPALITAATNILTAAAAALPSLLQVVLDAIPSLIQGILTAFDAIVVMLPALIKTLVDALPALLPQLISGVIALVVTLAENLINIIMPIIDILPSLLTSIIGALLENLPILLQGAISLVLGIVGALPQIIVALVEAIPTIITMVLNGVLGALPQVIAGLVQLIVGIVAAIPQIIEGLINSVPTMYMLLIEAILKAVPQLIVGLVKAVWEIIKALPQILGSLIDAIVTYFVGCWNAITMVFGKVKGFFKGVFGDGFDGIKDAFKGVTSFFNGVWKSIKDIFSKVGSTIGEAIKGTVSKAVNSVLSSAVKIINGFIKAINAAITVINAIPAVNIKKLKLLDVPQLEKGGVLKKGQVGLLEGNGAEAVVPLEKNTGWLDEIAKRLNGGLNGGNTPIYLNVDGRVFAQVVGDSLSSYYKQTGTLPIYLG